MTLDKLKSQVLGMSIIAFSLAVTLTLTSIPSWTQPALTLVLC